MVLFQTCESFIMLGGWGNEDFGDVYQSSKSALNVVKKSMGAEVAAVRA